jgi:hypothetical protein
VAGSELTLGATANIDTHGKFTISGNNTIVIEARMAGPAANRDTTIALVDVASPPGVSATENSISFGDTSYSNWGFRMNGYGIYNFVEVERPAGVGPAPQNVTVLGVSTNAYMEYRLTITGTQVKMERGPTLATITQTATRTLGQSVVGKSFYVRLNTGGIYSPAVYDWVRVSASQAIVVPVSSFLPTSRDVAIYPDTCQGGLLLNAPPYTNRPNAAEWSVPITTAGNYRIEVEYAAALSRPVEALVDGVMVNGNALAGTTGSWCATPSITSAIATVSLTAGNHVFRLQRSDVFPHLKEIRFVPI